MALTKPRATLALRIIRVLNKMGFRIGSGLSGCRAVFVRGGVSQRPERGLKEKTSRPRKTENEGEHSTNPSKRQAGLILLFTEKSAVESPTASTSATKPVS